ncbi:MAG: DUF2460 domain-containing protein [Pseudomonadota bacterium]
MAFHEVRFPEAIAIGAQGGPERRTEIVTLASGHEARNAPWAQSRRRWDAGLGMRSLDDLEVIVAFFEARNGQLNGFRWRDPLDHRSAAPSAAISATDQPLGAGDGFETRFQLVKVYGDGAGSYERTIAKPVAGSVTVAIDGALQFEGADYTVDAASGEVTFLQAPAAGTEITAGFEFDVPVRFDTDRIETSLTAMNAGEIPSIPVVEIRL